MSKLGGGRRVGCVFHYARERDGGREGFKSRWAAEHNKLGLEYLYICIYLFIYLTGNGDGAGRGGYGAGVRVSTSPPPSPRGFIRVSPYTSTV